MSTLLKIVVGICAVAGCCKTIQAESAVHDAATCTSAECCSADKTTSTKFEVKSEALVCTLSSKDQIERRTQVRSVLSKAVLAVEESETGYTITFESESAPEILEYIRLERECCTFFLFSLEFPPKHGPLALSITGPDGAKEFLKDMIAKIKPARP